MKKTNPGPGEFRALLPYLKKYRAAYALGFLCLVAVDGAQAVLPQFVRRAVDLITTGDFAWIEVFRLCLAMLAVMALVAAGRFLWRYFIHGSSRRIETELRDDLFSHLLSLSWDFYQKHKIGDLMARSINDINAVRNALGWGLVTLVDGTIMAAAILAIIFVQDPRTAAFCVIPLPLVTAAMFFFGRAMGSRFHRAQESYSALSDVVQETFAGIRVIKSFVKEWWFIKKFGAANDTYRGANMELVKIYGAFFPLVGFLAGLTTIILLVVGGRRVVAGYVSPGELVALFSYLQMLIWPLMGAGFMVNMIQRGAAGMGRINEILAAEPSIKNPAVPRRGAALSSGGTAPVIELRNLSFSYRTNGGDAGEDSGSEAPRAARPVLRSISLALDRGTVLGILGRTGSGKSTLLKTLTRMVDPPPGTVFVDGTDVRDWDLADLRGLFGVSPQDSYLFSDSIKNNIAYGAGTETTAGENGDGTAGDGGREAEPEPAALALAASLSALDGDLGGFTRGWDTLIGERGLTLSGGQKQRVAIARALLSAPAILVLDDAFSAVDAQTEKRILTGILDARGGGDGASAKTTIIVSQRVSTLSYAATVAVLEAGGVSELGSPEELLAAGGFFARMAELQRLGETAPPS
ncbi:MAG: ABC transporter ATP-binding protein/permease [Treponema sp.]|jgi:ATP-binding cassette subfamily B protein|nr:ABC transporter ATP-binding protein/permease [Treponema sp.]